jgi:hypothetical protein
MMEQSTDEALNAFIGPSKGRADTVAQARSEEGECSGAT